MSTMLSIFGPTLALYMLGLIFYTVVETGRSLRREAPKPELKAGKRAYILIVDDPHDPAA